MFFIFYAEKFFKRLYNRVMKTNIPAMIKAANTILNHIVILCKKSFLFFI
jgi:hypothetical protein